MPHLLDLHDDSIYDLRTRAEGPAGSLPFSPEQLRGEPSGNLFGWTQNVGMGWKPDHLGRPEVLILSTHGGLRGPDGEPIALGYHTGHFEVGLLVEAAAREVTARGGMPFAGACSDPCDGRSQGTAAMFDSLAYRNDAAMVFGRLIRSLPTRTGVIGVATCDKGLPAMMMALARARELPVVLVPGGVTLPAEGAEDLGKVQTIGARYAQGEITLEEAAREGCRSCGSPGGGCQFLGTAASSQVVAEALGLALTHAALMPSGSDVWREGARQAARAVLRQRTMGLTSADIVTGASIRNAMVVHAAFGGSTNLLLHLPAIAFSAGLRRPGVDDWRDASRHTPRLVDVLPNGPIGHPTVQVFLAGGVPEVMLHLRALGLLQLDVLTACGETLGHVLEWWEGSERRARFREVLRARDGVDPDVVILAPERA
ncbi:MAG: dihydroxy-acid dehydratase, partial [Armatimonadetes bacterium]|nr:dihydroxy-acid dehydratase [Armatimonadota bacterium]